MNFTDAMNNVDSDELDTDALCEWCEHPAAECECGPPPACPVCGYLGRQKTIYIGGHFEVLDSLAYIECGHLIAGQDDSGFYQAFAEGDWIPRPNSEVLERDWTEDELREILGEVFPVVIQAYDTDLRSEPEERDVLLAVAAVIPGAEAICYTYQHPSGMVGWDAFMICSAAPEQSRSQIQDVLLRIQKCFYVLAARQV